MANDLNNLEIMKKGFIKSVLDTSKVNVSSEDRVKLIRKGNELYGDKNFEQAKKIFLATNYSDGLCRIGDYYSDQNDFVNALKFYVLSKRKDKYQALVTRAVSLIQNFIHEEKGE